MTIDPRCCGSGTCIVDPEGRCWCGQQWDGEKMCNPTPGPRLRQDTERQPESDRAAPQQDAEMNRIRSVNGLPAAWPAPVMRQGFCTGVGRRGLSLGFVVTVLSALTMSLPASAAAVTEPDARAVRAVIEAQLQALRAGNAERAFSFASAAIRAQFGDAANFMLMVQAGYPMLVQPAATSFFVPTWADGAVVQKVHLKDRSGRLWVAAYQLQLQADSTWRINGCAVIPDPGNSST